ncbi:MAG: ATP-binding cassette domain-containing protein [Caldilineaceae bacterium]
MTQTVQAPTSATTSSALLRGATVDALFRARVVLAVDGATFDVQPGKTLGIVGESGCGKSVAAKSILQIVDRPGRVVGGEILYTYPTGSGQDRTVDLLRLGTYSAEMRSIRSGEISMIFQEPMSAFSPVHTVGNRLTGRFAYTATSPTPRRRDRHRLAATGGYPQSHGALCRPSLTA